MPEPRLLITVGTSLLSSASWRAEGRLAVTPGYSEWTGKEYLENPARRRTRGWRTAEELTEVLSKTSTSPAQMAELFEWDPSRPSRYSAELTTLIRLWEKESDPGQGVGEFLRRYGRVDLVAPSRTNDPARIAADHLAHLLSHELGHPNCRVREVLRSRFLIERIQRFSDYLQQLPDGPVDLLVTGAYKGLALVAGLTAAGHPESWRVIYLHEDQEGQLVLGEADRRGVWIQSTSSGEIAKTRLPSPTPV